LPPRNGEAPEQIGARDVDRIKYLMREKSPQTVNNALTGLSKLVKVAVEWEEIERMPCTIRLLKAKEPASPRRSH
jgi:hypothetical protein